MKNRKPHIFNLDTTVSAAESLYEKKESQALFKKDKKLEQELLACIKKHCLDLRKVNAEEKPLVDTENLDKTILTDKTKPPKATDNPPPSLNKNTDALSHMFNKLSLAIQIIENTAKNINKLITAQTTQPQRDYPTYQ